MDIRQKRKVRKLIASKTFHMLSDYSPTEVQNLHTALIWLDRELDKAMVKESDEEHTSPPDMPRFLKPQAD